MNRSTGGQGRRLVVVAGAVMLAAVVALRSPGLAAQGVVVARVVRIPPD